jgi:phosphoribosylformylglycinamidine cyclo-ligase
VILGLPSSGFHSNGFSLLRKLIPTKNKRERSKWIQSLLTPTKIYVPALLPLMENGWVEGAAHITGSGFLNIPRISNKVDYEIFLPKLSHFFPLLSEVQMKSGLSLQEMLTTFNCGIGMVLIVKQKNLFKVKALLKKEKVITLGNVCKKNSQGDSKVLIHSPGESLITLT